MSDTLFDIETIESRSTERAYAVLQGRKLPKGAELTARQRELLRVLVERRGLSRALSRVALASKLGTSDREVRADVNELRRVYGIRIGSSRNQGKGGYYLITTAEELMSTVTPMVNQVRQECEVIRAMTSKHELREIAGQLQIDLTTVLTHVDQETSDAH